LRIEVEKGRAMACKREAVREVDGCRRLADAALLVCEHNRTHLRLVV